MYNLISCVFNYKLIYIFSNVLILDLLNFEYLFIMFGCHVFQYFREIAVTVMSHKLKSEDRGLVVIGATIGDRFHHTTTLK